MGSSWSCGVLVEFDGAAGENKWAVYIGKDYSRNDYVVYLDAEGEVRSGLLEAVAAGHLYKVNNKYDQHVKPYSPSEIVYNAQKELGRRYIDLGPEKFAALMRHGSSSEAWIMDAGDIIEFQGEGFPRWSVYIGHGMVVHLFGEKVRKTSFPYGCAYKVNNQYDCYVQPLTRDQIVATALKEVGKVYADFQASVESFAAKMRYGISFEGPFPKPGDLIEYLRGIYQHWAVYDGNLNVIHLTGTGTEALSLSASRGVASALESTAQVKNDHMEVVGNGSRYRVNNKYDHKKKPFIPSQVLANARSRVGESRWYHALKANCEHFATEVRYGEGICEQVGKAIDVVAAAVIGGGGALAISGTLLRLA